MTKKRTTSSDGSIGKLSGDELMEALIKKCMTALKDKKMKVTIADLIRIRALREQLAPLPPRGEVTWTDTHDKRD